MVSKKVISRIVFASLSLSSFIGPFIPFVSTSFDLVSDSGEISQVGGLFND